MDYASPSRRAATDTRHRDDLPDRGSSLTSTLQGKDWRLFGQKSSIVDVEKKLRLLPASH
jgi:hypothetical protein